MTTENDNVEFQARFNFFMFRIVLQVRNVSPSDLHYIPEE